MPPAFVGGPSGANGYFSGTNPCNTSRRLRRWSARKKRKTVCRPIYYPDLASGGTGLTKYTPDTRITSVNSLPAGPFQLTNGNTLLYNDYAASPVHRFYQMWQQENCTAENATYENPSGCTAKLFS